jgi:hypothetical protein
MHRVQLMLLAIALIAAPAAAIDQANDHRDLLMLAAKQSEADCVFSDYTGSIIKKRANGVEVKPDWRVFRPVIAEAEKDRVAAAWHASIPLDSAENPDVTKDILRSDQRLAPAKDNNCKITLSFGRLSLSGDWAFLELNHHVHVSGGWGSSSDFYVFLKKEGRWQFAGVQLYSIA